MEVEPTLHGLIEDFERDHWWYRSLRSLTLRSLGRYRLREDGVVLDAGCSTAHLMRELQGLVPSVGFDMSMPALELARRNTTQPLCQADVRALPFADGSFDAVVSLDVLSYLPEGDDAPALQELFRVLVRNGILILNLPAHGFLRGGHDAAVGTLKRYSSKPLRRMLQQAGFEIVEFLHWNVILLPAALLVRRMTAGVRAQPKSDLERTPVWLNIPLAALMALDIRLARLARSPVGCSVFVVARKPNE